MRKPNTLPQTKQEYVQTLATGKPFEVAQAAFIFYHCEVPLEVAKDYVKTLESKCQKPKSIFSKP